MGAGSMRAACGSPQTLPAWTPHIGGTQMQGRLDGGKSGAASQQAQAGDKAGRKGFQGLLMMWRAKGRAREGLGVLHALSITRDKQGCY